MRAQVAPENQEAESLVPPRPNLGPEPWAEERGSSGWVVATVAVLLLLGWWVRSRRRSRKEPTDLSAIANDLDAIEPTPRQKLIATSEEVRDSLLLAFGTGWRSKTTEEIGNDPNLIQRLEPAEFNHLIALLRLADRAKFADDEPDSLDDWEVWAVGIIARLSVKE